MTDDELKKEATKAWEETTTWGLTWEKFIALTYFRGSLENGSDGKNWDGPDRDDDIVYIHPQGGMLTRYLVNNFIGEHRTFIYGYMKAREKAYTKALQDAAELCRTKELMFDVSVWLDSTKKEMTALTANALADEILKLETQ